MVRRRSQGRPTSPRMVARHINLTMERRPRTNRALDPSDRPITSRVRVRYGRARYYRSVEPEGLG
jgi:hypothetical protein